MGSVRESVFSGNKEHHSVINFAVFTTFPADRRYYENVDIVGKS
jgi:hypothetical protein